MLDKGFARHGYPIADTEGRVIGEVTSGSISPMTKIGIAMGYVETAFAAPGTIVWIHVPVFTGLGIKDLQNIGVSLKKIC